MLSKHELRFHLAILDSKGNKFQQKLHKAFYRFFMVLIIKFTTIEQRIINGNILLEYQKLLLRKGRLASW